MSGDFHSTEPARYETVDDSAMELNRYLEEQSIEQRFGGTGTERIVWLYVEGPWLFVATVCLLV